MPQSDPKAARPEIPALNPPRTRAAKQRKAFAALAWASRVMDQYQESFVKTERTLSHFETEHKEPSVSEFERLKLQNLILQHQLFREQLNNLTMRFLQTPEARTVQEKIEAVAAQANELSVTIFRSAGLDPKLYQLNLDTGLFVRTEDHLEGPSDSGIAASENGPSSTAPIA